MPSLPLLNIDKQNIIFLSKQILFDLYDTYLMAIYWRFFSLCSRWRSEPFTYHRPGRVCESQRGTAAVGDREHTAGDTIRPEASPTQGPPADPAAQGLPGPHNLPCGHRGSCATGTDLPGCPLHHSNRIQDSSPASPETSCSHALGGGVGPRTRRQRLLGGIGGGPLQFGNLRRHSHLYGTQ